MLQIMCPYTRTHRKLRVISPEKAVGGILAKAAPRHSEQAFDSDYSFKSSQVPTVCRLGQITYYIEGCWRLRIESRLE